MNRWAVRLTAPGLDRSEPAVSWRHSASCVRSCESIWPCIRALVPPYNAKKLATTAMIATSEIASASCARRLRGAIRLNTTDAQPVPDVAHRLDRAQTVVGAELAPEIADVDLE